MVTVLAWSFLWVICKGAHCGNSRGTLGGCLWERTFSGLHVLLKSILEEEWWGSCEGINWCVWLMSGNQWGVELGGWASWSLWGEYRWSFGGPVMGVPGAYGETFMGGSIRVFVQLVVVEKLVSIVEIGCRVCTDQPSLLNIPCGDLVVELCRRQIEDRLALVIESCNVRRNEISRGFFPTWVWWSSSRSAYSYPCCSYAHCWASRQLGLHACYAPRIWYFYKGGDARYWRFVVECEVVSQFLSSTTLDLG